MTRSFLQREIVKSERNAGYTDIFFVNTKSTNFKYLSKYKKRFKSLKYWVRDSGSHIVLYLGKK